MFPKGSVARHKVTGRSGVVIDEVTTSQGHQVDVNSGFAPTSERWPCDSVVLESTPADSDIMKRLADLESRVGKLESQIK